MQLNFLSFRRGALSVTSTLVILGALLIPTSLAAQWFEYPSDGVPRKADGSVDMTAPTPRLADGKPDLSGVWTAGARNRPGEAAADDEPGDPQNISSSRNMADIGVDLPEGLPYQPWLVPIVEERTENQAIDDPHIRCLPDNFLRAYGLPHLLKFVHTSGLVVVLNEMNAGYRQVFTDARPLPDDPNPTWQGYSSAEWSGDTLVVDTSNFKGYWGFTSTTPTLHVVERFTRTDADSLHYEFTVNDPGMWTGTWKGDFIWPATTKVEERVYEYACHEGNYAVGNMLRGARLIESETLVQGGGR